MSGCFECSRIPKLEALVEAYDAGLLALASGAQSYTLDTGQTRINKTAFDVSSMKNARAILLNELALLRSQCCCGCSGALYARPLC